MASNFGHAVDIEVDQVCGVHRYRANCRNCSYVSGWCTTAAPWPDAPQRPRHEAQARALSAAQGHLRGRLQVLPTQGPVPIWERAEGDRPPSAEKVAYSVAAT
jgi:hypothetical protein